jgi:hypothetical protein
MAAFDPLQLNAALRTFFLNGRGEVGLEVGADPGLSATEFIQIPRCMIKPWAARLDLNTGTEAEAATRRSAMGLPPNVPVTVRDWDEQAGPNAYRAEAGWITNGSLYFNQGNLYVKRGAVSIAVTEFHIEPMTSDDIRNFYTVNIGHVKDAEFDEATLLWVHAIRFWSVAMGFVATSKSSEYTIVDTPAAFAAGSEQAATFIFDYSSNASTACAARATSWRKSNHATGGPIVQGFPRRWLQKMGYMVDVQNKADRDRAWRNVTSAFYIATHASSVHAVLALMAPQDANHWALIDPQYGLFTEWDVKESTRIRMLPSTQVAGAAMVSDAVVTMRMLIKEGLSPLLANLDQAAALAAAYQQVEENGIRLAVYASWFLEGHPDNVARVEFSQKDSSFASLVGELAIVATKYYIGTTIAGSAALGNAAQQMGEDSARNTWTQLGLRKSALSAQQVLRAFSRIKGASTAGAVAGLLSEDSPTVVAAVAAYNGHLTTMAAQFGIPVAVTVDAATIQANAEAADAAAAAMSGT